MGTTVKALLIAARAKVATVATSRDAAVSFLEHTTNLPFEKSPIRGRDGFEIVAREMTLQHAFGVLGDKEGQFFMVVRLGHAPFSTDKLREELVTRDIDRLGDILEAYAFPSGISAVWFEGATTDKTDPNWWVSELRFRVVYFGAVETS